MIKVIETNLSIDDNNNILDHQSRVIEVELWEDIFDIIVGNKPNTSKHSCLGVPHGNILQKEMIVLNLKHDDYHLSCDIINRHGFKSKKLFYRG